MVTLLCDIFSLRDEVEENSGERNQRDYNAAFVALLPCSIALHAHLDYTSRPES
jgi:hypothetical protein